MNQRGGPIAKTWRDVALGGGGGGGGGVTDGDKGDIVVSGSGSTWTIDNNAVTFANMPDLAASEIIGSESGGDPHPITVIAPLYVSSNKLLTESPSRLQVLGMLALGGL